MTALSGRGSPKELWHLQSLAAQSLVISVTRKCPLTCGHCITRSSPNAPGPILDPGLAGVWAGEFPAMAAQGLRNLTLTGGEPVLAREACSGLVRAAVAAGMAAFVVSSAVWARSTHKARQIVKQMGPVTRWDLGIDGWHAREMPLERIGHALDAILDAGGQAVVRLCDSAQPDETARIEREVARIVRGRAPMLRQSVRAIGRAAGGEMAPQDLSGRTGRRKTAAPAAGHQAAGRQMQPVPVGLPRRPCVSTGLFVRADGTTGPCCSGLAYEALGSHPFDYGTVRRAGDLAAAWAAWKADPLLRLMRIASLAGLNGWLDSEVAQAGFADDPCEACVSLWSRLRPGAADDLAKRAEGVRETVTLLEARLNQEMTGHDEHSAKLPV